MKLDANPRSMAGILLAVGVLGIGLVLTFGFFSDPTLLGVGVAMIVIGAAGLLLGVIHVCAQDSGGPKKPAGEVAPNRIPKEVPQLKIYDDDDYEAQQQEEEDAENGEMYYEPCSVSPPRGRASPDREGSLVVPTAQGLVLSPYEQKSFPVPSMLGPHGSNRNLISTPGKNVVVVESSQVGYHHQHNHQGDYSNPHSNGSGGGGAPYLPHQDHDTSYNNNMPPHDMSAHFSPNHHGGGGGGNNHHHPAGFHSSGPSGPSPDHRTAGPNNAFKKLEPQLEQPAVRTTTYQTSNTTITSTANAHGVTGTSRTGNSSYVRQNDGPDGQQHDPVLGSPSNAFRSSSRQGSIGARPLPTGPAAGPGGMGGGGSRGPSPNHFGPQFSHPSENYSQHRPSPQPAGPGKSVHFDANTSSNGRLSHGSAGGGGGGGSGYYVSQPQPPQQHDPYLNQNTSGYSGNGSGLMTDEDAFSPHHWSPENRQQQQHQQNYRQY